MSTQLAGFLCAASGMLALLCSVGWAQPAAQTRARYLVLDSRIIDAAETKGVKLTVGKVVKHPANPLFKEEHPWEPRFDNLYANILHDAEDKLYKCWYSPFIIDRPSSETPREKRETTSYMQVARKMRAERGRGPWRQMGICYAVSQDGLKWDKPLMDIHKFRGRKSNILVEGPHGAGIFKDAREKDPARRYKMFYKAGAMTVAFSPDGLRWSKPVACPQMKARGDTHNNAFWSPERGKYVAITRLWDGQRIVGRSESSDFIHWTPAKEVLRGRKSDQTYAMPVFRCGGVYLGLVMILRRPADRVHCELTWSPDTVEWHRIDPGTPLIPNTRTKGAYDWGCVYAAAYPVFGKDEVRLYYGASNGLHTNWRDGFLALATLRPDGFAGYEPAAGKSGTVVTKAVTCSGKSLRITADAKGGRVRVEVIGAEGRTLADCKPVTDNVTDAPVAWKTGGDLSDLRGKRVRLRFRLTSAKLYSFRFGD